MAHRNLGRKAIRAMTRMSVSLPSPLHFALEQIAQDKKVSLAWVMREAAEKYVADQRPPLARTK